ncbi:hypothetical protein [Corynebacterium bouchesdurhonense]|uniref:hypothetical protein n=1 Tax=Corynebacterium bouchesdurhonense TaxID=1720192 RepID=UPI00082DCD3F|nr:hypothetical protein [Corynebacterium bouchesdurhonense]
MESTNWWNYVEALIGEDTYSEAAAKAGFDKSAFTRWKQGARADADFAVKLARAYEANVLDALVAAGFITPEEAGATGDSTLDELRQAVRLARNASVDVTASSIRLEQVITALEEEAGHRSSTKHLEVVEPLPYAANRRAPEPEEGDDDFGSGA